MSYSVKQKWSQLVRGGGMRVSEQFGLNPLTARVLLNRDLAEDEEIRRYLYGTLEDLDDPLLMDQISDAAEILHDSIEQGDKIRVIGDYDADGILSTYILVYTLQKAGACVSFDIPDRTTDGFGISMRLVKEAYRDGVGTLITCDNGIAQVSETACAKKMGMKVIITDHHEPNTVRNAQGEATVSLPEADAVVDPKKPGCRYPNKNLCGAGVAWKLMYLYESRYLSHTSSIAGCPFTMDTLPFAAAATVTDLMKLSGENRILVKTGLELLSKTENAGMQALLGQCALSGKKLNAGHIGFTIGPCLNASGRLSSAKDAVRLLLESDRGKAEDMAGRLIELNERRKDMTDRASRSAISLVEQDHLEKDRVLVLYLKDVHESVAGIAAAKVKESLYRPVILLTDTENPKLLKGSGRSIEAYNMHEELDRVSDLLVKYGGHAMAAGVTIEKDKLELFRKRLNENCTLTQEDLMQKILLDAAPPFSYLSEDLIRELNLLEPYGMGNRAPLFGASQAALLSLDIYGRNRNCIRMTVADEGCKRNAVLFRDADEFLAELRERFSEEEVMKLMNRQKNRIRLTLAYRPVLDEFHVPYSVQLQIAHFQ